MSLAAQIERTAAVLDALTPTYSGPTNRFRRAPGDLTYQDEPPIIDRMYMIEAGSTSVESIYGTNVIQFSSEYMLMIGYDARGDRREVIERRAADLAQILAATLIPPGYASTTLLIVPGEASVRDDTSDFSTVLIPYRCIYRVSASG
jgi:hypothetical protein